MASHPVHAYRSSLDFSMLHLSMHHVQRKGAMTSPPSLVSLNSVDDPSSSSEGDTTFQTDQQGQQKELEREQQPEQEQGQQRKGQEQDNPPFHPFKWLNNMFSPTSSPRTKPIPIRNSNAKPDENSDEHIIAKSLDLPPPLSESPTPSDSENMKNSKSDSNMVRAPRRRRRVRNIYQPRLSTTHSLLHASFPQQDAVTSIIRQVHSHLPSRYSTCDWQRVYSTLHDGMSLQTLYNRCAHLSRHCPIVLLVKDVHGSVFGSYAASPWRVHPSYYGSGETFVFKISAANKGDAEVEVFRWVERSNNYFQLSNADFLAVGGGGQSALFIDAMLERGSSHPSPTFKNSCLATEEHFEILDVEAYTLVPSHQLVLNVDDEERK